MALDVFDKFNRDMWNLKRGSLEPLTSVSETEDKIIIEIDLPLVSKKDIYLRLVEEGLEVEASLSRYVRLERWGTMQRSCEFKYLYKIVPLPSPAVSEDAKATFKKGILRVELRKRKELEHRIPLE
ncbi:Hsp20/alpha crystallin family protein [Candidatus Bathyarchaeota archaeon]|nr:Hsp20/alpha crystallin family protein [Candidatus Bathyarchaeota archaeon]